MNLRQIFFTLILVFFAPLIMADVITDGSLVVDIDNNGHFNEISLNGQTIDSSTFVQRHHAGANCSGFSSGSAVNVVGAGASYTATCGDFDVQVNSDIIGPLASNPATTNVLLEVLVFTNNTDGSLDLESVSYMDQDLVGSGNDTVFYDAGSMAVVATDNVDAAPNNLFWATIASTDCDGTFGWDVAFLGSQSVEFPMDNSLGPVGPGDTAMSIGFNCGAVAPGQSVTMTYQYLFSTDLTQVPADFGEIPVPVEMVPVPGLTFWGLLAMCVLLGIAGIVSLQRRFF